jgi:hypothetical protein
VGCATSSDNLGCRTGYLFIQLRRGVEPGLRGVHVNMYLPGFLFKSSKSFVLHVFRNLRRTYPGTVLLWL